MCCGICRVQDEVLLPAGCTFAVVERSEERHGLKLKVVTLRKFTSKLLLLVAYEQSWTDCL